jgi:hypothetical protein
MLQLANRPIGRWFFDPVGMGVPPAKLHEKPDACGGAGGFACQLAGRPATFFNACGFSTLSSARRAAPEQRGSRSMNDDGWRHGFSALCKRLDCGAGGRPY